MPPSALIEPAEEYSKLTQIETYIGLRVKNKQSFILPCSYVQVRYL
jgi:hypothetical protein